MREPDATNFDLFVWSRPRDLDVDGAISLIETWRATGGDPSTSPFERSTDVGWFYRELKGDFPDLDAVTDAVPTGTAPIWASATNEPPARVVAIRLSRLDPATELESIFGLTTKYDLVVFDPRHDVVRQPLADMAAHASATFWPRGAIQAATAGGAGLVLAFAAWLLGIPILSGLAVLIGGFLVLTAVLTFGHAAVVAIRNRNGSNPPAGR